MRRRTRRRRAGPFPGLEAALFLRAAADPLPGLVTGIAVPAGAAAVAFLVGRLARDPS